jgi:hypothetical protein
MYSSYQCCGSGCFWSSPIRIHLYEVQIRIPLRGSFNHQAKKVRKKPRFLLFCLWLLTDFLSLKNFPKLASKGNTQKSWGNFCCCCRLQGHGFTALVQTTSSRVCDRGSSFFVVFNRKFDVFSNALLFIKLLLIGTLNLIPRILLMHFITVHPCPAYSEMGSC